MTPTTQLCIVKNTIFIILSLKLKHTAEDEERLEGPENDVLENWMGDIIKQLKLCEGQGEKHWFMKEQKWR